MEYCELVAPYIYRISVPLPDNPLRTLNSYVITSGKKPLVVDLGFNRAECSDTLTQGLRELGLSWDEADVLITHAHPDHCGGIDRIYRPGMKVYAGFPSFYQICCNYYTRYRGFYAWLNDGYELLPESCTAPVLNDKEKSWVSERRFDFSEMGDIVIPLSPVPIFQLDEGDVLDLGKRRFEIIKVKGHDTHHLCLFDPHDGVLVSGDQVLKSITPNIVGFALGEDLLARYLSSLDRLNSLPVSLVLTGHRDVYSDLPSRVAELKQHHRDRTEEMLEAICKGNRFLKDIAHNVSWRNPIQNWEDWPNKQKYFSLGETLAHLTYLESMEVVHHELVEGGIEFLI